MEKFNEHIEAIEEMYARTSISKGSIRAPRNLRLSEEFVEAFKKEYTRLEHESEGRKSKKKLLNELSKSLQFLVP
jgi:hypothetical protein